MKLVWSTPGLGDLIAIADYIATDDPIAAHDVIDRVDSAVGRLADHPRSGRPGRIEGTRERLVAKAPYIVAYRIRQERVQILRILHAARKWPGEV